VKFNPFKKIALDSRSLEDRIYVLERNLKRTRNLVIAVIGIVVVLFGAFAFHCYTAGEACKYGVRSEQFPEDNR